MDSTPRHSFTGNTFRLLSRIHAGRYYCILNRQVEAQRKGVISKGSLYGCSCSGFFRSCRELCLARVFVSQETAVGQFPKSSSADLRAVVIYMPIRSRHQGASVGTATFYVCAEKL
ncbi:uncharacterized protein BDV14DRAFT_122535 [Aspergillus stella-maris]|uniref:uncharacterized protein n=1 Tax=Aspergillus stella-maris TaxID=1810926 RepID=UPI003CCD15C8